MPHSAESPLRLQERPLDQLMACHECDLLLEKPSLAEGEQALCPRCGYVLGCHRPDFVRRSLALVITALLLYGPAVSLPILQLNLLGQRSEDTLLGAVAALYGSGMHSIALLVFLCSIAIPLVKLLCQLFTLLCIRWRRGLRAGMLAFRGYHHLREWGMLEVYLIGVLVSIVKLISMAELKIGLGFACFVALMIVQIWLEVLMSPHQTWEALEDADARP